MATFKKNLSTLLKPVLQRSYVFYYFLLTLTSFQREMNQLEGPNFRQYII